MFNDFNVGPLTLHMYGLFTGIALIAALILACFRAKKRGLNDDICYGILFSGVIVGYLCSKLTFVIVEWDSFIKDPKMFLSSSGFVVIGGLVGGVLGAWAYCSIKKVKFIDYFDLCAPSIAIAQGFGRIGCFMAGCCYGRETTSKFGVVFPHGSYAPAGVKLIPTQLISSGLDFLNMAFLLLLAKKAKKKGVVSATYIITYSIGRFLLEYLRNDPRGAVGILSTSQFFSIITLSAGIIYLLIALKVQKNKPVTVTDEEKEAPAAEADKDDTAVDSEESADIENYEEPTEPDEE